jgi:hypothetical protein
LRIPASSSNSATLSFNAFIFSNKPKTKRSIDIVLDPGSDSGAPSSFAKVTCVILLIDLAHSIKESAPMSA